MNKEIFLEDFMSDNQKKFFKEKLLRWKSDLLNEKNDQIQMTQKESDIFDMASNEANITMEFKSRDRENRLISKIDEALKKLEDGTYGYCEETGEQISLERLIVRPIATLSVEAQELREKQKKTRAPNKKFSEEM